MPYIWNNDNSIIVVSSIHYYINIIINELIDNYLLLATLKIIS